MTVELFPDPKTTAIEAIQQLDGQHLGDTP